MSETDKAESPESSRKLLRLFVCVVILPAMLFGVASFYFDYLVSRQRLPWKCGTYLRQIAHAMHHYHNAYGALPPPYTIDASGKRLHSWRTLILPFMDHHILYEQLRLDEPWDSPHNRLVENRYSLVGNEYGQLPRDMYHCPSDPEGDKDRPLDASYFVVTGPGTAWQQDRKVTLTDLVDGAANTIMVIDVADSGIHWMEPRDFHIDEIPLPQPFTERQGITRHHVSRDIHWGNGGDLANYKEKQSEGGMAVTFSGDVFFLPCDVLASRITSMLIIDDGAPDDNWRDTLRDEVE
ncbi:MAG: DUF1559 family PulG-like putative transporter [Planctomycetales bacterium]